MSIDSAVIISLQSQSISVTFGQYREVFRFASPGYRLRLVIHPLVSVDSAA